MPNLLRTPSPAPQKVPARSSANAPRSSSSSLKKPPTSIQPSRKLQYMDAFISLDLDGDGRLQRGEISEVLRIVGMPASVDDVDSLFASASKESKAEGLTMEEFVETMMLESGPGVGVVSNSLRPYIMANADTTTKRTYKSRLDQLISERNAVKHKKLDPVDELSAFLLKNDLKCVLCHHKFESKDNSETACAYHPLQPTAHTGTVNHLDRVVFPCCGGVQIGSHPVLHPCEGCCRGPHMTSDDPRVLLESARKRLPANKGTQFVGGGP